MLIFLIPFLFDYVLGGIFFITGYNLANAGVNAVIVAAPMMIWGGSYVIHAPLIGRLTTRKNAKKLLLLSGGGTCGVSMLFLLFSNLWLHLELIN